MHLEFDSKGVKNKNNETTLRIYQREQLKRYQQAITNNLAT